MVLKYVVQFIHAVDPTKTYTVIGTSFMTTALKAGEIYSIAIIAVNVYGPSLAASISAVQTRYSPPKIVSLVAMNNGV